MNSKFFLICIFISQVLWAGSFRLLTYNILSDDYLWDGVYDYVNVDILNWENRRIKIVERIKNLDPDIICLQELNSTSFEYFRGTLNDFEGFFAKKGSESHDGVGTFCKKNSFKEIQHKAVLCNGTSKCGQLSTQPAIFTNFLIEGERSITLINTKIRWSQNSTPGDPIWNHVQFLLQSIPNTLTIIVGDFNMTPAHPLMQQFYKIGLRDGFADTNTYSCYANGDFLRVDYILSTKDLQNIPFTNISLIHPHPIPNQNEPSDHLPLGSIITYE